MSASFVGGGDEVSKSADALHQEAHLRAPVAAAEVGANAAAQAARLADVDDLPVKRSLSG